MSAQLHLEPMSEARLPALRAVIGDPEIARFTRFPSPVPDDFVTEWYARYAAGRAAGSREAFAAVARDDDRFLGLALAPQIDREAREMELGYLVSPAERGRGVASELLRQLTDWAFDAGQAVRVSLIIDVDNIASSRAAARAGYLREGVLRSTYFKQGLRSDVELWARLAGDPAP
ncbi:MAG: GNAT family N-acetyltransferase [Jatrophihabitans sp.]